MLLINWNPITGILLVQFVPSASFLIIQPQLNTIAMTRNIQRGLLEHILDHQLYLVLYFHHAPVKSAVIWRDQVSFAEWKALKTLAKTI